MIVLVYFLSQAVVIQTNSMQNSIPFMHQRLLQFRVKMVALVNLADLVYFILTI